MKKLIHDRLQQLRSEQAKAQAVLDEIEEQKHELTCSLHRIQGAIQVLTGIVSEQKSATDTNENMVNGFLKRTNTPPILTKEAII